MYLSVGSKLDPDKAERGPGDVSSDAASLHCLVELPGDTGGHLRTAGLPHENYKAHGSLHQPDALQKVISKEVETTLD